MTWTAVQQMTRLPGQSATAVVVTCHEHCHSQTGPRLPTLPGLPALDQAAQRYHPRLCPGRLTARQSTIGFLPVPFHDVCNVLMVTVAHRVDETPRWHSDHLNSPFCPSQGRVTVTPSDCCTDSYRHNLLLGLGLHLSCTL